jgi:pimeloyl-ACP methyl ester carboxylesterase
MTTANTTSETVRSADGTTIAYERSGSGPTLILVDAASGYRGFGPMRGLARLLVAHFTVVTYDRRGRGESTDTPPYAVDREVDDLAALIDEVGAPASLYGFSSGALLALRAAARGLPIHRLALLEPPIATDEGAADAAAFTARLDELVSAGRRADAVRFFQESIGVPPELIAQSAPMMPALEAIAPTLAYDARISKETGLDVARAITQPTLVLDSQGSSDDLTGWASALVAALPNGAHRSLPGGWHGVADTELAPVLTEFLQR